MSLKPDFVTISFKKITADSFFKKGFPLSVKTEQRYYSRLFQLL